MSKEKKEIADNIRAAMFNVNELIEDAYRKHEIIVKLKVLEPLEDFSHPYEAVQQLSATIYEEF